MTISVEFKVKYLRLLNFYRKSYRDTGEEK